MSTIYVLGIETTLKSGVVACDGRIVYDTVTKWSKGSYSSMAELLEAGEKYLKEFSLAPNQRIVIQTKEVQ